MKTLNFSICDINAIDSYLYAGNLYIFFESGRIAYVSFTYLIRLLQDIYPQYRNLFQIAFLHNDYTNSNAGRTILGINGVRSQILKEWNKAQKEVIISISLNQISNSLHEIGEWTSMPLDVRLYAMRLYIGCENGLYESFINQDDKARVTSSPLDKVFDSKVVSVNTKYGTIAISADRDGLFSSSLEENNQHINVSDRPSVDNPSLRTDWKDYDLLSYDAQSKFHYIHNESHKANTNTPFYATLRKGGEYKYIEKFAIQVDGMTPLLDELDIKDENLCYCFNSGSSAFIKLQNGEFFATDFKQRLNGTYKKTIKEDRGCKKIMSSAVIPNGCILRYYDRIILYRDNDSILLHSGPTYGIRSYMSSNQYRGLITINSEDSIGIHTTESFKPSVDNLNEDEIYGRVKYNNIFRLRKPQNGHNEEVNQELPF